MHHPFCNKIIKSTQRHLRRTHMRDLTGKIVHSNPVIHSSQRSHLISSLILLKKILNKTSNEMCALNVRLHTTSWMQVMHRRCGMGNHAFGYSRLVAEPPDIQINRSKIAFVSSHLSISPLIQADDPLGGGHGLRWGVHRHHLRLHRCASCSDRRFPPIERISIGDRPPPSLPPSLCRQLDLRGVDASSLRHARRPFTTAHVRSDKHHVAHRAEAFER